MSCEERGTAGISGARPQIKLETGLAGWGRSLDRTSLHLNFPANREINREFRRFRLASAISAPSVRANSSTCPEFPTQGNREFFQPSRDSCRGIREFTYQNRNHRRMRFPVHTMLPTIMS